MVVQSSILDAGKVRLQKTDFKNLDGWQSDDHLAAFAAFLPGAEKMSVSPYKTRKLGIDGLALQQVGQSALSLSHLTQEKAHRFFEEYFTPHIMSSQEDGFVTGFFEPVVNASLQPSSRYSVPLYRRPPELIDIDEQNRPHDMDPYFRFGQLGQSGVEEYFDRPAIQSGALEGRGLELVWLENKVDVFFIHVQGSAKLLLDNGETMRVTYAAKSGHRYTSVAKVLCQQTGIAPELMTADQLSDWMHNHPDQIDGLLANNRSYIFFKSVEDLNSDDGPVAAAKIPLVSARSLAVDRALHTFGTPIWVTTNHPLPRDKKPLARLMFAHDTGSAIVGPVRGDIFVGSGDEAGMIAGKIRHQAQFTILVPKS